MHKEDYLYQFNNISLKIKDQLLLDPGLQPNFIYSIFIDVISVPRFITRTIENPDNITIFSYQKGEIRGEGKPNPGLSRLYFYSHSLLINPTMEQIADTLGWGRREEKEACAQFLEKFKSNNI